MAVNSEPVSQSASAPLPDTGIPPFLIARGGPFNELQIKLGLMHQESLHSTRRALVYVALAFGVPLLLCLAAGTALPGQVERPFLLDPTTWARFAVAIAIFVLMERTLEARLRDLIHRLAVTALIPASAAPAVAATILKAIRRRDLWLAELVCFLLAAVLSLLSWSHVHGIDETAWLVVPGPAGMRPSLAGWWAIVVSSPIFWFLLIRWLWRYLVWALLLPEILRLDLKLVATHPDGMGGLRFVGTYPNAFTPFVLALSCVLGASIARRTLHGGLAAATLSGIMTGWFAVIVIVFGLPLVALAAPLSRLKDRTLLDASAQATRYQRAVERELFGKNHAGPPDPAEPSGEDLADPGKFWATVTKMQTFPIQKSVLLPLGVAALLPLLLAGLTEMPFKDLLKIARGILL